ncbi:MAG: hypothetical protein IJH61_01915 [Eubacteriaceae bacterium]|nr:hypothetical protein [Eubacteriaceae bacterium]
MAKPNPPRQNFRSPYQKTPAKRRRDNVIFKIGSLTSKDHSKFSDQQKIEPVFVSDKLFGFPRES